MKSHIQKKNGGIVELLIPTFFQKKASHEGTKTSLGKKIMGRLLIEKKIGELMIRS